VDQFTPLKKSTLHNKIRGFQVTKSQSYTNPALLFKKYSQCSTCYKALPIKSFNKIWRNQKLPVNKTTGAAWMQLISQLVLLLLLLRHQHLI
jgi:hypothetical protein